MRPVPSQTVLSSPARAASDETRGPSAPAAPTTVIPGLWPQPEALLLPESRPPLPTAPAGPRRAAALSLTLTGRAPLKIPRKAEIVASAQKWQLAITHFEPDNRAQPKYYLFDRRKCLDLILAVKRAWWRIAFHRAMRKAAPGTRLEGIYTASELLELKRDLFGDHISLFGMRLRKARHVKAFRRGMLASMRLGRRFSGELVRNRNRLA